MLVVFLLSISPPPSPEVPGPFSIDHTFHWGIRSLQFLQWFHPRCRFGAHHLGQANPCIPSSELSDGLSMSATDAGMLIVYISHWAWMRKLVALGAIWGPQGESTSVHSDMEEGRVESWRETGVLVIFLSHWIKQAQLPDFLVTWAKIFLFLCKTVCIGLAELTDYPISSFSLSLFFF